MSWYYLHNTRPAIVFKLRKPARPKLEIQANSITDENDIPVRTLPPGTKAASGVWERTAGGTAQGPLVSPSPLCASVRGRSDPQTVPPCRLLCTRCHTRPSVKACDVGTARGAACPLTSGCCDLWSGSGEVLVRWECWLVGRCLEVASSAGRWWC